MHKICVCDKLLKNVFLVAWDFALINIVGDTFIVDIFDNIYYLLLQRRAVVKIANLSKKILINHIPIRKAHCLK
jgi:hypothetical protein